MPVMRGVDGPLLSRVRRIQRKRPGSANTITAAAATRSSSGEATSTLELVVAVTDSDHPVGTSGSPARTSSEARLHPDGAAGGDVAEQQDAVPLRAGQAGVQRVTPLLGSQDRLARRRVGGSGCADRAGRRSGGRKDRRRVSRSRGVGAAAAVRHQRRVDLVGALGRVKEEGAVAVPRVEAAPGEGAGPAPRTRRGGTCGRSGCRVRSPSGSLRPRPPARTRG